MKCNMISVVVASPAGGVRRIVPPWLRGDSGAATAEYAIGTLAAAALASVLYTVVTSTSIAEALSAMLSRAFQGPL